MAINAQLLSEMEIPDDYIESLPKVGQTHVFTGFLYTSGAFPHFVSSRFGRMVEIALVTRSIRVLLLNSLILRNCSRPWTCQLIIKYSNLRTRSRPPL